jgi:hypothetical protein
MLVFGGYLIGRGIVETFETAEIEVKPCCKEVKGIPPDCEKVKGTPPNKPCCQEKKKETTHIDFLKGLTAEAEKELKRTRVERLQLEVISLENKLVERAKTGHYDYPTHIENDILDRVEAYFKERGFVTKRSIESAKHTLFIISWGKSAANTSDDSNPDRVLESDSRNVECPK